jgi:hypothetical protein
MLPTTQNASFRIYYNRAIHPMLLQLERQRRWLIALILASILTAGLAIWLILRLRVPAISLFLWIPAYFYIQFILTRINAYKRKFKPLVVNKILEYINPDLRYDQSRTISPERVSASCLFAAANPHFRGEDFISGKVGDIPFEMCEIDLQESSPVRGAPSRVFRGIFFYAKFEKAFQGRIIIIPRADVQFVTRSIKAITFTGGQRVDIQEHRRFHEHFVVYADSIVDVTNFLSDELIDNIIDYKEKHDKKMFLSIVQGYLYIAVTQQNDMLEPNILSSNLKFNLIREFYDDLNVMSDIVKDFDVKN